MNKHIEQHKKKYAGGTLTGIAAILIAVNSIIDSAESIVDKFTTKKTEASEVTEEREINRTKITDKIVSKDSITTIQKAR